MTRLQELSSKLIDDALTADELRELDALLAADPAVARDLNLLLDVEAALRGTRRNVDVSSGVLAQIDQERDNRVGKNVMREITRQMKSPGRKREARPIAHRRSWADWVPTGIAASVMFASLLWFLSKPEKKVVVEKPSESGGVAIKDATIKETQPTKIIEHKDTETVVFSADFANGTPAGWVCGAHVTTALPPEVKGAMKQVTKPGVNHFGIYSQWPSDRPIFVLRPDDIIHFTYRADANTNFTLNLTMSVQGGAWKAPLEYTIQNVSSDWQTLDLPAANFTGAHTLKRERALDCYLYCFKTQRPDINLTLSRFWVTRPNANNLNP